MKKQRIATLLCTAALLLCAASPPALAADRSAACYYPVEVESYTAGDFDQPRIRKVYQLSLSDDPAGIPTEDFEEYGMTFHLMEMTRKDEVGVDTQPLTKTVTTDSTTGDLGEILKQLAPEIEVETEGGYAGVLKLDYRRSPYQGEDGPGHPGFQAEDAESQSHGAEIRDGGHGY